MAQRDWLITNRHLHDLNPLVLGEEECRPGHSFGPAVRQYTLIHYVVRGKGVFYARGGVWPVEAGQAFLIRPGEVTTYTADTRDPWHYRWVGFDGTLSADFARLDPVIELPRWVLEDMLQVADKGSEYLLSAELLRLYAHLFDHRTGGSPHVQRVEDYIRANFMRPIRVEDIAARLSLDRRYLSRIFKAHTGLSIKEYLVRRRLEQAGRYLRRGSSVKEAAALCGYEDAANFSKRFKQHFGVSPRDFRGE
ncbi:MAG: AraC family transcriptional regulator [Oscillospiraceae bacterium]|nr:AraC family transcriptional regulator [Oscillospiraceae bacterium]